MNVFINFYLIPPVIFFLLTMSQLNQPTFKEASLAVTGAVLIGLFAGFVLHMAIIIGKKIRK